LGAALAKRPGRTMAEHGFLAEPLNVGVVHVLEIIPGLIVNAGMGGAIPEILIKIFGRFGDPAIARPDAAGRLAHAGFRLLHTGLFGLDANVAFETGWARCSHDRIMGSKA